MGLKETIMHGIEAAMRFAPVANNRAANVNDPEADTLKPTQGAVVIDMRGVEDAGSVCGQTIAGTGALVFEGELLGRPRFH